MNFDITALPFLALYAETHFRFFRFFPSFLYQKQPEVLFDMPKRVNPGKDVPVLLICNDIDKFPIEIKNVTITASQNRSTKIVFNESNIDTYLIDHPLKNYCTVYLFPLAINLFTPGNFAINGRVIVKQKNKEIIILNDNLKTSSKSALTGTVAEDKLPGNEWCLYGDLHVHSQYTRSHVEFGPPVKAIDTMASASGLSFIGITDHSYDLSCSMENYIKPDPSLHLWKSLSDEILTEKNSYETTMILGEEISSCNNKNRVVHLGALGIKEFIPGSKDGARKQIKSLQKEPNITEAIDIINKQGGISFAAHPGAKSKIMQKIFLKRGVWSASDVHKDLNAFQAVNSGFSDTWYRARKLWIALLLQGRKLPLIAGNDSHGDFNRYRSIGTPFLSISENFKRHFAYATTGIYGKDTQKDSLLEAIKNGKTFITTGPYLGICSTESPKDSIISHSESLPEKSDIFIIGISTHEFGIPKLLNIFRGYYKTKEEKLIHSVSYSENLLRITNKVSLDSEKGPGYLRAALVCIKEDGTRTMAVTSPCYLG